MIEPKFNSIPDLLQHFSTEQVCIEYLENLRWEGEVVSPFDETSKVYRCKDHLYRCKNTGKYFNAKLKQEYSWNQLTQMVFGSVAYYFS